MSNNAHLCAKKLINVQEKMGTTNDLTNMQLTFKRFSRISIVLSVQNRTYRIQPRRGEMIIDT